MLLSAIVTCRDAPADLRDAALRAMVERSDFVPDQVLASPLLPVHLAYQLAQPDQAPAWLSRPDADPDLAIAHARGSVGRAMDVLHTYAGPDRARVIADVAATHPDSRRLAAWLLPNADDIALRADAALTLLRGPSWPETLPPALAQLVFDAYSTDPARGTGLAEALAHAADSQEIRRRLRQACGAEQVEVGTADWWTHPGTTPHEVLAWVTAQPNETSAYWTALVNYPRTAPIARAALRDAPDDPHMAKAVLARRDNLHDAPEVILEAARNTDRCRSGLPDRHQWAVDQALQDAPHAIVTSFLRAAGDLADVETLRLRLTGDTTADELAELDAALNRVRRDAGSAPHLMTWDLAVAAHPNAGDPLRRTATARLSQAAVTVTDFVPGELVDALARHGAAAGARVPLVVLGAAPGAHAEARSLLDMALMRLLPSVPPEHTQAICSLAPDFTGTLTELLDCARGVCA